MRLALDIDGTITQNPIVFRRLMEAVLASGGEVYLITGRLGKSWKIAQNSTRRVKQLEELGIPRECYTDVYEVVSQEYLPIAHGKASLCETFGVDLFIEDNTHYIARVHEESGTQCLLIIPREGGKNS